MKSCFWMAPIVAAAALWGNELSEKNANSTVSIYHKELDYAVFAKVDYLLWFSNQDGLHSPTVATGKSPNTSSSQWSSGVRATIGGQPADWDIELAYTYYSTHTSDTAHANIEGILASTPSTAGIFKVGEQWQLNFNRLDLQLGRKLLFGDHFLFEPFFGLEGLDTSQKFNLNVETIFLDLTTALPATDSVNSKNKNEWLGIGPRGGFKAHCDFKAGFGLYGLFGLNLLWGKFKIKQDYNQTDYYSSGDPTVLVDQEREHSSGGTIANTDLEVGLMWRHLFSKSNYELAVKLSWEQHYYIDILRFQDYYLQQTSLGTAAYTTNGNLALSGLSIGVVLRY